MISRRDFLASSAAAGIAGAQGRQRPNILFIMVDEMRWDVMGCEKHAVVETPNLDALAKEGVRFASSYTASPVCSPGRACAFTGRHAHVHGVTGNQMPANAGEIFLPSMLKHYGYHTAISGKLHYSPQRYGYGFDQFWSFSSEGPTPEIGYNEYLRKKHGSPAKWPIVPGTCPWPEDELGRDVGLFKYPIGDFETEWITDRSIDYLQARQKSGEPWFLFTSYLKPHSPSVEPDPYFSKYDKVEFPIPKLPANARELRAQQTGRSRRHYVDDERMVRVMSSKYFGAVNHIDAQVGRLLGELKRLGMADNTLVLFTADHGNMLGEKGRWFKGLQWDGSSRVPLIWRGPKGSVENGGRVVREVVDNCDLVPSILESAGVPVPERVQGKSFVKLARGTERQWKNRSFSQLRSGMVVDANWKLIDNSLDGTGPYELYDLRNDPRENRNLAEDAKQKDRVASYRELIGNWRADRPAPVKIAGMSMPDYAEIGDDERRKARANAPRDGEDRPVRRRQ